MGLAERPGSIESGDVPRCSYIRRNHPVSELSIFIDESGNFGPYDCRSPYYIITMVFHEQSVDISGQTARLNQILQTAASQIIADIPDQSFVGKTNMNPKRCRPGAES